MPRKKKVDIQTKSIAYNMQPDVYEALEEIMKKEGHTTMHKAINACILQRKTIREALKKNEDELHKSLNDNHSIKEVIASLVGALRVMDKYTKTS
jgi:hypothetical protein